jgi:predicted  nucleic acid-binding Zn-ribbon protein
MPQSDTGDKVWAPWPAVVNSLFVFLCLLGIALLILAFVMLVVDVKGSKAWKRIPASVQVLGIAALGAIALGLGIVLPNFHHPKLDQADPAEGLTGVATASGAIVTAIIAATTLYAVILLRKSVNEQIDATNQEKKAVEQQTKQLRATAIQNVGHEMMDIDRWMADHPDHLKALRLPEATQSEKGAAAGEIYADFIDQVVSQEDFLPDDHVKLWRNYFADIIGEWPQLRKYMEKTAPRWYLETMNDLLKEKAEAEAEAQRDAAEKSADKGLSLWDEASRQGQEELEENAEQKVWGKLVPLFDEFAEGVKAKRVKPNGQYGFKKACLVDVGSHTCAVTKNGQWSFSRAYLDDGVRIGNSIGNRAEGLLDPQSLSGADPEQWRKAIVAYIAQHRV